MLTDLQIHGLAIIDRLAISFAPGFNVITGETGAGKSILIRALSVLLGAKTSADVVREGHKQAMVSGQFDLNAQHEAWSILAELGVSAEGDDKQAALLIRRVVTAKGRSSAWVNDTPITIASLRRLGRSLVDIFAQHDNQSLLDEAQHIYQLDAFLTETVTLREVASLYRSCWLELKNLQHLIATYQEQQRSQDYLQFRFTELSEFDPSSEDYAAVYELCHNAEATLKKRDFLSQVQQRLDQGAGGQSLAATLWGSLRLIEKSPWQDASLADLLSEGREVAGRLDDMSYQVGRLLAAIDFSDRDWEAAQERLALYQSLYRRFGVDDVEGLLGEKDRMQKELTFLSQAMTTAAATLGRLVKLSRQLQQASTRLRSERKKAVGELRNRVRREFKDLAMPKGELDVEFEAIEQPLPALSLGALGADFAQGHASLWGEAANILSQNRELGGERVRFLLSTNAGEPLRPLSKVASGGEVSRIMLALKKALVAQANTCILVFDEIDTGISGRVADMVGRKIRELAQNFQVICISHLPQVAAYADCHLQVSKTGAKSRTDVSIRRLDEEASIEELARLLSGESVTDISLANARSLRRKRHDDGAALKRP